MKKAAFLLLFSFPIFAFAQLSASGYYLTDGTNYYLPTLMFQATLPIASAFSWINQGPATETATRNALTLYAPHNSSTGVNIRMRTSASARRRP